jgi:hypothetical protein
MEEAVALSENGSGVDPAVCGAFDIRDGNGRAVYLADRMIMRPRIIKALLLRSIDLFMDRTRNIFETVYCRCYSLIFARPNRHLSGVRPAQGVQAVQVEEESRSHLADRPGTSCQATLST